MTRIIGGRVGGRRLTVPPVGTRPTSDRVREAVFSALEARIELAGARVLDLYAGSGALGLEALSRGAASVSLVDADQQAHRVITANIAAVGLPGATATRTSVSTFLDRRPVPEAAAGNIDLVFWDPPYAEAAGFSVGDFAALLPWLAPGAIVVAEVAARRTELTWPADLVAAFDRRYGETRVEMRTRRDEDEADSDDGAIA